MIFDFSCSQSSQITWSPMYLRFTWLLRYNTIIHSKCLLHFFHVRIVQKYLLDKVWISVCECSLHMKLSWLGTTHTLCPFAFAFEFWSDHEGDCDPLELFQAIQDGTGAISTQFFPFIIHPEENSFLCLEQICHVWQVEEIVIYNEMSGLTLR